MNRIIFHQQYNLCDEHLDLRFEILREVSKRIKPHVIWSNGKRGLRHLEIVDHAIIKHLERFNMEDLENIKNNVHEYFTDKNIKDIIDKYTIEMGRRING
jgi:hypothetical protein